MIQWSIAQSLPDQYLSIELCYDPMIHRSIATRPISVPRIRLWSNDPSLHRCQTNICPKNQAMIQWSIAPSLPDQHLSQESDYDPMIHRFNAARPSSVPRIRLWSNDPALHRCQTAEIEKEILVFVSKHKIEIKKFSFLSQTFEHLNTWTFEHWNIWSLEHWTFECLNFWIFEHLNIWTFEHFNIWSF